MESGKGIKGMQGPAGVPAPKKKQDKSPPSSCDRDNQPSPGGTPIAHRKSTSSKTPPASQAQAPVAPPSTLSKSVIQEMVTLFLQQKTSRQDKTTSPLPQEDLQRLEKELNNQIKDSESFKRLSLEEKIDLYIILVVIREQLGKPTARDKVIKALQAVKSEPLNERLTLLVWLRLPAITAPSQEGGEQVSKFIQLALKTGFPPALWQALRLSIQPGGCEAISPSLAINILQRLHQTASSLPQILALGDSQVERYLATGDLKNNAPFSEHDQFLYLMAQSLNTGEAQEDNANLWTLPEEIRSELASILAFSIQQLSRSPSKPDTRLEKAIESGEGIELSLEHLMHFINKKALGLPEYQKAITLLLATGASDLCDSQTASKNRRNAMVNQENFFPGWQPLAGLESFHSCCRKPQTVMKQ